MYKAVWASSAR